MSIHGLLEGKKLALDIFYPSMYVTQCLAHSKYLLSNYPSLGRSPTNNWDEFTFAKTCKSTGDIFHYSEALRTSTKLLRMRWIMSYILKNVLFRYIFK